MRRFLVINVDDFGYSVEWNEGMVICFLSGVISGVMLMVNGVVVEDVVNRVKNVNMLIGILKFNMVNKLG